MEQAYYIYKMVAKTFLKQNQKILDMIGNVCYNVVERKGDRVIFKIKIKNQFWKWN